MTKQSLFSIGLGLGLSVLVGGLSVADTQNTYRPDFDEADSSGCTLAPYADCTGADLHGANLVGLDLTGIILKGAILIDANLTDANLRGADLTDAQLNGADWSNTTCPNGTVMTGIPCGLGIAASESGFSFVESIHYSFRSFWVDYFNKTGTTPAMIWYSFHPAEYEGDDPSQTPIFVMLNGGPGGATSANLFANNTAPYTVTTNEKPITDRPGYQLNEHRWTRLGHLLYIDPPLTGFSYNIGPSAINSENLNTSKDARYGELLGRGNFNPFIDAAQVLRVVLRFLDNHEELQGNPVVLVGESYGGIRVSTMLNLLLFSDRYNLGAKYDDDLNNFYRDAPLVEAIKAHFRALGKPVEPLRSETVAAQFGRQVLIQPQLTPFQISEQAEIYWKKPSIIDKAAESVRKTFDRKFWDKACKKDLWRTSKCVTLSVLPFLELDRYNWNRNLHWTDDLEANASKQLHQLGKLNAVLGVDINTLADIKPLRRVALGPDQTAYKVFDLPIIFGSEDQSAARSLLPGIIASQEYIEDQVASFPYEGSLEQKFGELGEFDRYFMAWNAEVYNGFWLGQALFPTLPLSPDLNTTYGDFFLENALLVETFLTDAYFDLVLFSEALPEALNKYHRGFVSKVVRQSTPGDSSLGQFTIYYNRDYGNKKVNLYYPHYGKSGHAVASSQPRELRNDIARWLACSANKTCYSK
ncbi:MAG: pentapeptide repeat-containing protein [Lamprocystis purpurea]|jgi:hypothetical protein|uniref:pentapeptide repeat-containing protein n=1 Tax=Lamprocystis purpurea TaxID=61598 RepID=UPI0003694706|nr:pentapeptide repeat-containing protein [Lamprocystis purpurea]MBV5273404.1 pentapeptide repeat-containing protein [Lamprocystis purpurea]